DKELRLPRGGYALKLAYKDFVDLNTVQAPDGKLLALQPGMELEYWLEAGDACDSFTLGIAVGPAVVEYWMQASAAGDFPKPNVSESKHYRVLLLPPEKDQEKLNGERDQAKQDQQKHEAKQNDDLQKEARKRLEDEQRRDAAAREEQNATQQA